MDETRDAAETLLRALTALLDQIEDGTLTASAGYRLRVEGAIAVLAHLLGDESALDDLTGDGEE